MGIFRRRRATATPELVQLPVGFDRTTASVIVARCEAAGIPIRLLTMDDHGLTPGFAALAEHRVLVREDDRSAVEAIIGRRYLGAERAEEFGARNGVPGELVVRLHPHRVTADFDVAG